MPLQVATYPCYFSDHDFIWPEILDDTGEESLLLISSSLGINEEFLSSSLLSSSTMLENSSNELDQLESSLRFSQVLSTSKKATLKHLKKKTSNKRRRSSSSPVSRKILRTIIHKD